MIALLLPIGVLIDFILQAIGFFSFTVTGFPIPFWLAVIWVALASLQHDSLTWMKRLALLAVVWALLWTGVMAFAQWQPLHTYDDNQTSA